MAEVNILRHSKQLSSQATKGVVRFSWVICHIRGAEDLSDYYPGGKTTHGHAHNLCETTMKCWKQWPVFPDDLKSRSYLQTPRKKLVRILMSVVHVHGAEGALSKYQY